MQDRALTQVVAELPTADVTGRYFRFGSQKRMPQALDGSSAGGRWGPPKAFPVLYLTDEYDSCVIEAYRHTTDPSDEALPKPKLGLITCDVEVSNILDLTSATARVRIGLDASILHCEPQGPEGAAYSACCSVAVAAHQLGRHGILAPAATGRGVTLALFMDLLPSAEQPVRVGPVTQWEELPADPRRLRIVRPDASGQSS